MKQTFSLAHPGFWVWAVAAWANRLPIAMAPLAMVFLVRERPDGYSLGGVLAASYVAGEMVGAIVLGTLASSERLRAHMAVGSLLGGGAFIALAAAEAAPFWFLILLAALAGALPAASPGGMQTLLVGQFVKEDTPRVLAAARVHGTVTWTVAPALVGLLALQVDDAAPPALGGALLVMSAALVLLIPQVRDVPMAPSGAHSMVGVLFAGWPMYATGVGTTFLVALTELQVAPLLEHRGQEVGWTGPILAGFSLVGVVGTVVYGSRRQWPGGLRTQSALLTMLMCAGVAATALAANAIGIGLGLLVAGLFAPALLLARNLSLREALPEYAHTAGFSVLYASSCLGYIACGLFAGATLRTTSPDIVIATGVVIVLVLTVATSLAEHRLSGVRASIEKAKDAEVML